MSSKWEIIGIIGIFFAAIYKIPQIIKIIKTKQGKDLSNKMFLIHTIAYVLLLIYQFGSYNDIILTTYYVIGIIQTLTLLSLKYYYTNIYVHNSTIESTSTQTEE